jgi:hypothetical protein
MFDEYDMTYVEFSFFIRLFILVLILFYFMLLKKILEVFILYEIKGRKKCYYKPYRKLRKYYYSSLIITFIMYYNYVLYETEDYFSNWIFNLYFSKELYPLYNFMKDASLNSILIIYWLVFLWFLLTYFKK